MATEKRLIDANALRTDTMAMCGVNEFVLENCNPYWLFNRAIVNAPTVDAVEVVHGRWVKDEKASENHIEAIYVCSACQNCEAWGATEKTNYCPNCGAKMDGDGNG